MREEFLVSWEEEGERIDKYLSALCPDLSRSYVQKLLKSGNVLVDGRQVKVSYSIQEGERIFLDVPEAVEPEIEAEPMELDILYEDKDVILVNKPKGMVVHPAPGHYSHTLVNGLMAHCKGQLSGINGILRPGIVHRIDMDTTGVLIACKNDMAHNSIAAQLKEHSIVRRYQAIVHGRIEEAEGRIEGDIGRDPVHRKRMCINEKNGKPAVTHYRVLERFRQFTYVECRLETGRTHQIRVHLSSIGHPLLGDTLYGPKKCPFPSLQGQTLHAMILGFKHPITKEYMEFTAPLPEYFEKLQAKLRGIR